MIDIPLGQVDVMPVFTLAIAPRRVKGEVHGCNNREYARLGQCRSVYFGVGIRMNKYRFIASSN